jgi:ribosome-associated translation inhibitor RaiA
MQTPIKIDFQGMDANSDVRTEIVKHVAQLEDRFGRLTAGRVVVKAPSGHHRTGGLYEINIHLALPEGRDINIDRTRQNDARYADLSFAVNDAFKRARRQLQDQMDRMKGDVKRHGGPVGI